MKKGVKFLSVIFCCFVLCFAFSACSIQDVFGGGYKSAYQIAVDNGYSGTEEEWLKSFNSEQISLYDDAVARGAFSGTFEEFLVYMANLSSVNNWTYASNKSIRSSVKITAFNNNETSGSTGSGTIISYDTETNIAHVLTCFHVIVDGSNKNGNYVKDNIKIFFYGNEDDDGSALTASFLGGTKWNDVAFVKVAITPSVWSKYNLSVSEISTAEPTLQEVDAIGNSRGKGINVVHCNVSKQYDVCNISNVDGTKGTTKISVMRVNAVLQQGNSGGGLFDINSKVVGIINSKANVELKVADSYGDVTGNDEYNFSYAIPASTIKAIYDNVLNQIGGSVTSATAKKYALGINMATLVGGEHYTEVINGLVYPTSGVVLEETSGSIEKSVDEIRTATIVRGKEKIASIKIRNEMSLTNFMWYAKAGDKVIIGYKDNSTSTIKEYTYTIDERNLITDISWFTTYSRDLTLC